MQQVEPEPEAAGLPVRDTQRPCDSDREDGEPGCAHYQRRCRLVSPCCGGVYWCRHCHNEERYDGVIDPKTAHQLDRTKVMEVVCAVCQERQPVAAACRVCANQFGKYFCEPCRFYDDDLSKQAFHCDGCGICRVGGRDQYFHCDKCVACLPLSMRDNHKCIVESLRVDCPVCLEFLHNSLKTASILDCGHALHTDCKSALLRQGSIRCPICNTCMVDMQDQWRQMDEIVAMTPMPHEYRDFVVDILCADCHESSSCAFHVVGLKCGACGSYNTARTGSEMAPDAPDAGAEDNAAAAAALADEDAGTQDAAHNEGARGEDEQ